MREQLATHEVTNQSPAFVDVNLFTLDHALHEAVAREGAGQHAKRLAAAGAAFGSEAAFEHGRLANENPPKLKTFDMKGRRIDQVEFHPAYHACMALSVAEGLHASSWDHLAKPGTPPLPGANVARSAGCYMAIQMEAGHQCPITMTNAAVATLQLEPSIGSRWIPKVLSRSYDASFAPAAVKKGVTIGMGMTEKQGGTDVRANASLATPAGAGGPGEHYRITGHKWFMSAPMCDAFLVLAQAPGGLSCFLMPRVLPDGATNALNFQRLKDKLGNRSNASSEVEFAGADAWMIGEEGRGVPAIIEMVTFTRLDCAVASTGLMRLALANALHHCRHRSVFQKRLVDQPMMAAVLADLALEVEAATALSFHLARSFDMAAADPTMAAWRRLMTPVTKYWVCKAGPAFAYEAMECLGGNGYVEEGIAARIYRELPVNAIWEGSGNVMALDLMRVLQREPETVEVVLEHLAGLGGSEPALKAQRDYVQEILCEPRLLDRRGRALAEGLALYAAGALLRAHAPAAVADAFIGTRLGARPRQTYGQGLERADTRTILDRALPAG
ncbi:MAG: acyl-CoA dehydrogenase family protein [Hyphomicrobiaceae bacterium]|nr:acyl-CoA dehydrogenase family protein [Hyphomicrobiaceae bacterium]